MRRPLNPGRRFCEFDRGRQVGTWRTYDRKGNVVKETRFHGW